MYFTRTGEKGQTGSPVKTEWRLYGGTENYGRAHAYKYSEEIIPWR